MARKTKDIRGNVTLPLITGRFLAHRDETDATRFTKIAAGRAMVETGVPCEPPKVSAACVKEGKKLSGKKLGLEPTLRGSVRVEATAAACDKHEGRMVAGYFKEMKLVELAMLSDAQAKKAGLPRGGPHLRLCLKPFEPGMLVPVATGLEAAKVGRAYKACVGSDKAVAVKGAECIKNAFPSSTSFGKRRG